MFIWTLTFIFFTHFSSPYIYLDPYVYLFHTSFSFISFVHHFISLVVAIVLVISLLRPKWGDRIAVAFLNFIYKFQWNSGTDISTNTLTIVFIQLEDIVCKPVTEVSSDLSKINTTSDGSNY